MKKYYVKLIFQLIFLLSVNLLSAQVVEFAEDDFGTGGTRENSSGFVEITTEQIRTGSAAFKHIVQPPSSGETKRAELQFGGFSEFNPDQTFWYGFSLYLPSSQFPNTLDLQFIGQLRFSNIPWAGYSTPNCYMFKECGGGAFYGGSGHELLYEFGELNFYLRHQEPGCADCEALDEVKLSLGTAPKDVWIDFVYQGTWTGNPDGFFNVWTQVDGGGYQQVINYAGRSWVENHPPTSQLANQDNPWKPRVSAPNFTVGLYYNRDNANRFAYSDHITEYIQQPGVDGFAQVSVGGVSQPNLCNVAGDPCDDGNPNTINDTYNFNCDCVGTSIAPSVSPTNLFVGKAAGSSTVNVTSMTNWTVSDDAPWLSTSVTSGSNDDNFLIFFDENASGNDRTGTVSVSGAGETATVTVVQSGSSCGPTPWEATPFAAQNDDFTASFDLRPLGDNIQEPIVGISHDSNPDAFNDNAILIQLATDGTFKVRDGGTYTSDAMVNYQDGETYGVEVVVNKNAETYSVIIDPPNGIPVTIASNYAFRSDWNGSFPLNHYTTRSSLTGCISIQNFTVNGQPPSCTVGAACDDGNPNTDNDVFDSNCVCAGTLSCTVGAACDDGDANTDNDVFDSNCVCAGTPNGGGSCVLTGTIVTNVSPWCCDRTADKAFDGDLSTFVDHISIDDGFVGLNLGTQRSISKIRYAPRPGFPERMINGLFQGSSDGNSWTTFYTISTQPADNQITEVNVSVNYQYYRYFSPDGGHTNIAELEFISSDCNSSCTIGASCDDGDACTTGDVYDSNCNCVGTFQDSDNDGICDANDTCDGNLAGQSCDDGNPNTINDVYDSNCNCTGTPSGGGACTTVSFTPTDDAQVQEIKADETLGGGDRVRVYLRGSGETSEGYFKWDLSSLPMDAVIESASMSLISWNTITVPVNLELREVNDDSWDEATITFNNRPPAGMLLSTVNNIGPNQEWLADVQTAVQGAVASNQLFSVNIQSTSIFGPPDWDQYADYHSAEGTQGVPITLSVCYSEPPACEIGSSCDDGDDCTINDQYDADCNCVGTAQYTTDIVTVEATWTEADQYAGQLIQTNGAVTVNGTVEFVAGETIELNVGFHTVAGSDFHAYLEDCPTASGLPPNVVETRSEVTNTELTVSIYPNPFDDWLNLTTNVEMVQLQLFSIHGQLLMVEEIANQTEAAINIASLVNGTYYVIIQSASGKRVSKKIIKI